MKTRWREGTLFAFRVVSYSTAVTTTPVDARMGVSGTRWTEIQATSTLDVAIQDADPAMEAAISVTLRTSAVVPGI